MEITWYGHDCFRLAERATLTIVTDPYDASVGLEPPKLRADVVTISRQDAAHSNLSAVIGAQRGDVRTISGPGEYEIGGVFITGISMRPEKKSAGAQRCTVYAFHFDGLNVAHLGGLSFVPSQAQIDALETVDVLLVPIGGDSELSPTQASDVISMIEPGIVIPMGYGGKGSKDALARFLKEMGVAAPKTVESLKITKSQVPEETQVVLLEMKR